MPEASTLVLQPATHVAWKNAARIAAAFLKLRPKFWILNAIISAGWLVAFNVLDIIVGREVEVGRWIACLMLFLVLPFTLVVGTYAIFRLSPTLYLDAVGLRKGFWGRMPKRWRPTRLELDWSGISLIGVFTIYHYSFLARKERAWFTCLVDDLPNARIFGAHVAERYEIPFADHTS